MFYVANNILSLCLITLNLLRPSCSFSNANRSTQYCLLVSHLALITVLNQSYLKKKKIITHKVTLRLTGWMKNETVVIKLICEHSRVILLGLYKS